MPGYGTPLGLTLPTIGGLESAAAPLINTALAALITRLESKVGAADLDINADVSFKSGATYSGLTNLQRAAFQNRTAGLTAATNPATVYVLNGDLHYIDGSGNLVQITAGGQVNVSTTGGITGAGYGATGVEVNWDSVNSRYRLRSGTATDAYADAVLSDVLFNDGSGNFVRLQAPSISADYTITLPTALPASTQLLQMTSGGVLSLTANPSVTSLTSATTSAGALTATTTATGAITVSAGSNITLSAGGRVRQGEYTVALPASLWRGSAGPGLSITEDGGFTMSAAALVCPLVLRPGQHTIFSVRIFSNRVGGAGNRILRLRHVASDGSLTTDESITSTSTSNGSVTYDFVDLSLSSGSNTYYLYYTAPSGDEFFGGHINLSDI